MQAVSFYYIFNFYIILYPNAGILFTNTDLL